MPFRQALLPLFTMIAICGNCAICLWADSASAEDIQSEREHLNKTLWQQETLAQEHDKFIVQMWDQMRNQGAPFSVLRALAIPALKLPQQVSHQPLPWGVAETRFKEGSNWLKQDEIQALIDQFEKTYRIAQSEWHHAQFEESSDGYQSLYTFSLHAINDAENIRLSLKGELVVAWDQKKSPAGLFQPLSVDLVKLRILERPGAAVFSEALQANSKPEQSQFGVVLAYDLNNDGLPEILLPQSNKILLNMGKLRFLERPLLQTPANNVEAAVVGDFIGNGRPDLLIAVRNGFPVLYMSDEQFRFTHHPREIGAMNEPLDIPRSITTGDIDGDGDLDLWIGQYKHPYEDGQMPTPYYDANDGFPSYLLRNDGNASFTDITELAGLEEKRFRRNYSSSLIDLNGDRALDLVTVNDFSGTDIFYNDGAGKFTDVTDRILDVRATFGMSHTFGDYNRDGRTDLYVMGMGSTTARRLEAMGLEREDLPEHNQMRMPMGEGNRFYLQTDQGKFEEAPFKADVLRSGWSWGSGTWDVDSDGYEDVYIANGFISQESAQDYCSVFWTHDIYAGDSESDPELFKFFKEFGANFQQDKSIGWNPFEKNVLFMNRQGEGFIDIAFLLGLAFEYDSRNVVASDLDLDGKDDLIVTGVDYANNNDHLRIYRNEWETENNWIGIRIPNVHGIQPIGATIKLITDNAERISHLATGHSFRSQHPIHKRFGLGKDDVVKAIEVQWLSGERWKISQPAPNRYHLADPR